MNAVLQALNPEIWLVTTQADGLRGGLVATSVSQASIVPDLPRMLVTLAKHHLTTQLIDLRGAFALHLLAEDQADLAWRFGLASGRDLDKFAGLLCTETGLGNPQPANLPAWLDCRVEGRFDIGDRILFVAEVVDGARLDLRAPLTLQRLIARATPEQLQQLRHGKDRDAALDAPLIRAWRHHQFQQQQQQQ